MLKAKIEQQMIERGSLEKLVQVADEGEDPKRFLIDALFEASRATKKGDTASIKNVTTAVEAETGQRS